MSWLIDKIKNYYDINNEDNMKNEDDVINVDNIRKNVSMKKKLTSEIKKKSCSMIGNTRFILWYIIIFSKVLH